MLVPDGTATNAPGSLAEPSAALCGTDKTEQSANDSQKINESIPEKFGATGEVDRGREVTERLDRLDQGEANKRGNKRQEFDGEHAKKHPRGRVNSAVN